MVVICALYHSYVHGNYVSKGTIHTCAVMTDDAIFCNTKIWVQRTVVCRQLTVMVWWLHSLCLLNILNSIPFFAMHKRVCSAVNRFVFLRISQHPFPGVAVQTDVHHSPLFTQANKGKAQWHFSVALSVFNSDLSFISYSVYCFTLQSQAEQVGLAVTP